MTAYYVLAIVCVAWALGLSAVGLMRKGFPPTRGVARTLMGVALLIAFTTIGVLLATTEKEHPREEAAEAAELAVEAEEPGPGGEAPSGEAPKGAKLAVLEDEFSIDVEGLEQGRSLGPGDYTFEVTNQGRVDHDFAIDGEDVRKKTALIAPDKRGDLEVSLKPGEYRFWCTVAGHAQAGMDEQVTVK